jgi:hypothetical protein
LGSKNIGRDKDDEDFEESAGPAADPAAADGALALAVGTTLPKYHTAPAEAHTTAARNAAVIPYVIFFAFGAATEPAVTERLTEPPADTG